MFKAHLSHAQSTCKEYLNKVYATAGASVPWKMQVLEAQCTWKSVTECQSSKSETDRASFKVKRLDLTKGAKSWLGTAHLTLDRKLQVYQFLVHSKHSKWPITAFQPCIKWTHFCLKWAEVYWSDSFWIILFLDFTTYSTDCSHKTTIWPIFDAFEVAIYSILTLHKMNTF